MQHVFLFHTLTFTHPEGSAAPWIAYSKHGGHQPSLAYITIYQQTKIYM